MSTPKWQGGKLYLPGDLVQPITAPTPAPATLSNPGFNTGDATGWTLGVGMSVSTDTKYDGSYSCKTTGTAGDAFVVHDPFPVAPGKSITASCFYKQGGASKGHNVGWVALIFYDAVDQIIGSPSLGNAVASGVSGRWNRSTVTATAPAGAAKVSIAGKVNRDDSDGSYFDAFSWDYISTPVQAGLIYKAVQPAVGVSGSSEPAWPATLGLQVIDNEVIWEAVSTSRVVWTASPILVSEDTEPDWPTSVSGFVLDNTISWEAVSRRVEDENCPNSKVVAIMSSKVFAADKDIIRFSATVNPLDWTTEQDAGYLPSGLQQANANDMAVLAPYRSNLGAMNANCFQNWQVDPDPAAMAILDQMDGVGSTFQQAAQAVGNELFYLAALGVRTVGIANASTNLQAGDVGMPVDPIISPAINVAISADIIPRSTYYPSAGQYWLSFADYPTAGVTETFVYSMTQTGRIGAWTRYSFPFSVDAYAQLGNDLYVRNGDVISRIDENAVTDDVAGVAVPFDGLVQWAWLDFGQPGVTKMLEGFDIVSDGAPSVSIGYDQRNLAAFTTPYAVPEDTLPGGIIPLPVMGPTFSVRINFAGGQKWSLQSFLLQFQDQGNGP